jgi:hypothetical protein
VLGVDAAEMVAVVADAGGTGITCEAAMGVVVVVEVAVIRAFLTVEAILAG